MSNTQHASVVVVPTVEETLAAFRALDGKARKAMLAGLKDRMMDSFVAGELAIADSYKALVAAITAPGAETDADLELAIRFVTATAMVANLDASLSDRARELAITAQVNPELLARLEGTRTTRTRVSTDGAKRSGSDEPKGCVKSHVVSALEGGAWHTVTEIADHASTGCGYTDTYRPSTGAVSNVLKSTTAEMIAHRTSNKIEVAKRPNGRGGEVLMARMRPAPVKAQA